MRVNVTYSVQLTEIRQIVQELLLKIEDDVEQINELFPAIQESINKEQESKAVQMIEACRQNIVNLDHALFDSKNILNGYQQATLQLRNIAAKGTKEENNNAEGG
jgi:Mg2+ and Co2+ transporter CorA